MGKSSKQAGFSLIEMMTVVVIIGIAAAIAVPSVLRYIRVYKIQGAGQQVASVIQTARLKAIGKNTIHGVLFIVLKPTPPGNPTKEVGFTYVLEDAVGNVGGGARINPTSALLTTAGQMGPLQFLPDGVVFDVPAAGAPHDPGMRFDTLGRMCDPGPATETNEPCPALQADTNYLFLDTNTGQATIALLDQKTKLKLSLNVTPGGRINFIREWE